MAVRPTSTCMRSSGSTPMGRYCLRGCLASRRGAANHPSDDGFSRRAVEHPEYADRCGAAPRRGPDSDPLSRGRCRDRRRFDRACEHARRLEPVHCGDPAPPPGQFRLISAAHDDLIRTLQQTLDLTVFMVTHDLERLRTVCDRIAAVADGTMVAIGTMSEMRQSSHPRVEAYFRGKRNHVLARAPGITGA